MEDGRIVLVGNENDVLHCGYTYPLNEGGKRFVPPYLAYLVQ